MSLPYDWRYRKPRPCTVHVRAQSGSISELAANELMQTLQAFSQVVVLSNTVEALANAYMVSNAERLRAFQEQLDTRLHLTEVKMEIH